MIHGPFRHLAHAFTLLNLFALSLFLPSLLLSDDEFSFCLRRAEMMSSFKARARRRDGGLVFSM